MTILVALVVHILFLLQVASTAAVKPRATVLLPTDDPFYTPNSGYESEKPGTILRSRPVEVAGINGSVTISVQAAYQLLFRSTDSLGNPSATLTTIIVPYKSNSSRLLSFQTAEDAAWLNCAPSYSLQVAANSTNGGIYNLESILVVAALEQGWILNIPDYEGPDAVFTSGIQAGQATLDSVRAALSSESITGISPKATYQMWGYSGGSLASEWAAELQPTYAPELSFAGVALGGVIPNITSVLITINNSTFAGLAATGIMGLTSGYPDLKAYIDEKLIPSTAAKFKSVLTQCTISDATFGNEDIYKYFDGGFQDIYNPIPQTVLTETGIMGTHGVPNMPIFVYKSTGDEVSPVADTDALVSKLCGKGARIQYIRDEIGEHLTELITGAPDAFAFLKDRFNGVPAAHGCSTSTELTDLLDGKAIGILGEVIVDALLAFL